MGRVGTGRVGFGPSCPAPVDLDLVNQPGAEPCCAVYRSPGFHALMAFSDW